MIDIGHMVSFEIVGRVAKKENGRVTGEFVSFKPGDIGIVVGKRKVDNVLRYTVKYKGVNIILSGKDIQSLRDSDIRMPRSVLVDADMRNRVSTRDRNTNGNAEY